MISFRAKRNLYVWAILCLEDHGGLLLKIIVLLMYANHLQDTEVQEVLQIRYRSKHLKMPISLLVIRTTVKYINLQNDTNVKKTVKFRKLQKYINF